MGVVIKEKAFRAMRQQAQGRCARARKQSSHEPQLECKMYIPETILSPLPQSKCPPNITSSLKHCSQSPLTVASRVRLKRTQLLRLLLLRLGRLCSFLAIASHHDHAQETAHHGAAQKQQDDGDADGPDAGWEEGLDRVRVVDEGLFGASRVRIGSWKCKGRVG
jgi:hypothetical protein